MSWQLRRPSASWTASHWPFVVDGRLRGRDRFYLALPNLVRRAGRQCRWCVFDEFCAGSPAFDAALPRSAEDDEGNASGAIGRLHGVESVVPINKGTGRRGLALCIWIKDADRAAPCMPTLRLGSGPCVRRLSYECGSHRSRSLSRRTRHPPPHHLFERRFTAPPPQRPVRGRQQTRGIPISPRGPTCSHHSRHAARAHALCQCDETSGVCERGRERG